MTTSLRLATWNVNSIRTRIERVLEWLNQAQIDILAIQETKCADQQFPSQQFENAGYQIAHWGVNQWNGVAIASRVGLQEIEKGFPHQPAFGKPDQQPVIEARALGATCGGIRVWSLYVPNGRTLKDPHYQYKLEWLTALKNAACGWLEDNPHLPIALVGDWNIAPYDQDVWDIQSFQGSTHVSPPERDLFYAITQSGFTDVIRPLLPATGIYTYWDYTQLRFPKNQGMRIDFILSSPALASRITHGEIVREQRKGSRPSDHAPVMVEISCP